MTRSGNAGNDAASGPESIAQLITAVRLEVGLSQSELAKLMHTGQPNIARMEAGRSKPTLSTLEMLAKVTGKRLEIRFL